LFIFLIFTSHAQQTQVPPSERIGDVNDIYGAALDRLFPRPASDRAPKGTIMSFVLRYEPGLDPALGAESQIKVTLTVGIEPLVEYYSADRRLESVLNDVLQVNARPTPDEIAARVQISRRVVKVSSSQALKWQREMLGAIGTTFNALPTETRRIYKTGTSYITLDASSYEIWYSEGLENFRLAGADPASPFAKWAEHFRSEVISKIR